MPITPRSSRSRRRTVIKSRRRRRTVVKTPESDPFNFGDDAFSPINRRRQGMYVGSKKKKKKKKGSKKEKVQKKMKGGTAGPYAYSGEEPDDEIVHEEDERTSHEILVTILNRHINTIIDDMIRNVAIVFRRMRGPVLRNFITGSRLEPPIRGDISQCTDNVLIAILTIIALQKILRRGTTRKESLISILNSTLSLTDDDEDDISYYIDYGRLPES